MSNYLDFKPAELHCGKETYVSYYAINPEINTLVRCRIKLNHIKKEERKKYGKYVVATINQKLYTGWNPFIEKLCANGNAKIVQNIDDFIKVKTKELRKDSLRSYKSYCAFFKKYLTDNGLADLYCISFSHEHAKIMMRFISEQDNISNKTYNNYLNFFRILFNYFFKNDYIKESPFTSFDIKRVDSKIREVIPSDIRKKIAQYYVEHKLEPYLHIMQLCYKCLIRPKEILMLKIKNIKFDDKMLIIPSSVAKNHCERVIAIPREIMLYLDTLKNIDGNLYIFSTNYLPGKKLINSRQTGRTWSIMRAALHLPAQYQFYSLKDTGITEMLELGVPAKLVKELADHHSLEMTEKYTHKSNAKKILEYNAIEF